MQPVRLWIVLALTSSMVCLGATAQEPMSSGTLNLVLANKNGFVIASDSRRSSSTGTFLCNGIQQSYCDDSQKLFKTSKSSAMVIAGFAAGGRGGTPLDLAVASVLRRRFGPGGNRAFHRDGSGKTTVVDASEVPVFEGVGFDSFWTKMALGSALTGVASLYDPTSLPESDMDFIASFAGIADGKVVLKQQKFQGSWISSGDKTPVVPDYKVLSSDVPVDGFVHLTAGITRVADAILAGDYKTTDPAIKRYYSKLHDQASLDSMSVDEMTELARASLRETAKFTDYVGGPDQIGTFPVNGEAQWVLPDLPKELALSPRFWWQSCLMYIKGVPPVRRSCAKGTFFEDLQHPLDEVIAQFFLASEFNNVSVMLDNNYFVRSRFENVTFKYLGAPFLALNGTYINCRVEFSGDAALPRGSEIFDHCEKIKVKTVNLDDGTIGRPSKWELKQGGYTLPLP